jgi:hypothetical protein
MGLVALSLGWMVQQARTEREAVAAIRSVGGDVGFNYQEVAPRTWSSAGRPSGPTWLRNAIGPEYFDTPVRIMLYRTPRVQSWIDGFNRLPNVGTLLLSGRHVTDDTLSKLHASKALVELHLSGAAITNDGLKSITKFPRLRWLVLNDTSVSDEGIAIVSSLNMLEELNLRNTKVSDDAVQSLTGLPRLKKIDLRGTQVTDDGATKIRKQVPKVTVMR